MIETELKYLELQIDKLIELYQQVTLENKSLRKKIATLKDENLTLLNKKEKAIDSIKKLILQLQDQLLCQTQK